MLIGREGIIQLINKFIILCNFTYMNITFIYVHVVGIFCLKLLFVYYS